MSDSDLLLLEMKRNMLIHLLQHFSLPIQNLHNSISAAGLGNRTKATTATIAGALGESYPPSHGLLDPAYQSLTASIISFLVTNLQDTPFQYLNYLFFAMLGAFHSPLEKAGGGSSEIVVSESGWPSAGGGPETNIDNARIYLTRVGNNRNTPGHLFCARKVLLRCSHISLFGRPLFYLGTLSTAFLGELRFFQ
ncbi:hypothetical protein DKX38_023726 [Salix brachista]|uniref:glucan endo-1,3-beta-D-glucosidase n=1 Tax=Salix brachista TaxID=2182728 RepID=A0A5N5JXC3_9ROSI|nr:hypothetical protein DKX38_023726 [Salix brachista]